MSDSETSFEYPDYESDCDVDPDPDVINDSLLALFDKLNISAMINSPVSEETNMKTNINYDGSLSQVGRAYYDEDLHCLNVYLPVYIKDYKFNVSYVLDLINSGYKEFDVFNIANSYQTDETKIPSCQHFVPSTQLVALGSKLPSKWKYTEAPIACSCVHPKNNATTSKINCSFMPMLINCSLYQPFEWTDIKHAKNNDIIVVTVQQSFSVPRAPKYKVIFGSDTKEFLSLQETDTYFDECVALSGQDLTVVSVLPSVENPYIETVLK
jgi:hypothetical protein